MAAIFLQLHHRCGVAVLLKHAKAQEHPEHDQHGAENFGEDRNV